MRYPIAFETGDTKHAFGVVVPDLPGCFSAGETFDDALTNARKAIVLHLDGLLDDGKPFPETSPIDQLQKKRSYRGWTCAVVDVDANERGDKAARINITLPLRILRAVDAYARKQGQTRSGFIARASWLRRTRDGLSWHGRRCRSAGRCSGSRQQSPSGWPDSDNVDLPIGTCTGLQTFRERHNRSFGYFL